MRDGVVPTVSKNGPRKKGGKYMVDLSTEYLGLELKNPIIVGSSGLTGSVEKM
jgi:hypothetical protein